MMKNKFDYQLPYDLKGRHVILLRCGSCSYQTMLVRVIDF